MKYISCKVDGVPYGQLKTKGKLTAPAEWSEAIKKVTKGLPPIRGACAVSVTFLLPPDKFPRDFPYGPDLDNLLKRLFDALNETVFSAAQERTRVC